MMGVKFFDRFKCNTCLLAPSNLAFQITLGFVFPQSMSVDMKGVRHLLDQP